MQESPTPPESRLERPSGEGMQEFIVPLCSVFRRHLKAENQKFTPERAKVLDAIIQIDRNFEAEELLFELRKLGMRVSKATIYRTIKLLIGAGIIEQVSYDQKQALYRMVYGRAPHDQLICVETGRVIDFSVPEIVELRNRIAEKYGWTPVGHRFQVYAISGDEDESEGESSNEASNNSDGS